MVLENSETLVSCVSHEVECDIFEINTHVETPSEEAKAKFY